MHGLYVCYAVGGGAPQFSRDVLSSFDFNTNFNKLQFRGVSEVGFSIFGTRKSSQNFGNRKTPQNFGNGKSEPKKNVGNRKVGIPIPRHPCIASLFNEPPSLNPYFVIVSNMTNITLIVGKLCVKLPLSALRCFFARNQIAISLPHPRFGSFWPIYWAICHRGRFPKTHEHLAVDFGANQVVVGHSAFSGKRSKKEGLQRESIFGQYSTPGKLSLLLTSWQ